MSRDTYKLFSEGQIGNMTLKNRLVRSATYEGMGTPDGKASENLLALYKALAQGGVGLIITGITDVTPPGPCSGRGFPNQVSAYDDSYIGELTRIPDAVHSTGSGCKVAAELNHAGRQVPHNNQMADCVGPSVVPSPILEKTGRELSADEVQYTVRCFADAIARVKKAGFDAVQLHGAHGWLLSSFFSPYTNHRTDRYGGSCEKRVAILREIVSEAREQVGDFPIAIKVNCEDHVVGGIDIHTFPEFAHQVAAAGVDAIEVSGGMWDCLARTEEELGFFPIPLPESRTRIAEPEKQSYFAPYVEGLNLDVPVMLVGGNRDVDRMEGILNRGWVSFMSLSRPLISEPDLPNRWLEGRGSSQADCISCNACLMAVNQGPVACVRKQSKEKHEMITTTFPRVWRTMMR